MIRDRQTSANVKQWRKVLSEPTLIMGKKNKKSNKRKKKNEKKNEKVNVKKSSLFYREKIELVLRWLRIYFNLATVHWFEQILCEEQHRQRYNRCAQCIDNENIGYDLAVREKRPTVAHKLTIPRAKFIRRPLWPCQRCAYAHQVHRPTSLTRAPIHTSNTPPRKGRFRTVSEIIIFFSRCTSWRHVSKFQRRHPFLATSSTLSHGSSCLDFSYGNDQRCNRVREHHNSKAAFSRLLPAGKVGTRSMLCRLFLATSLELGLLEVIKIYNANDMFSGGIEMPFLKFLSILVDVRICFLTPLNV